MFLYFPETTAPTVGGTGGARCAAISAYAVCEWTRGPGLECDIAAPFSPHEADDDESGRLLAAP